MKPVKKYIIIALMVLTLVAMFLPVASFNQDVSGAANEQIAKQQEKVESAQKQLDRWIDRVLDAAPQNAVFVVGHSMRGQEGLLVSCARGRVPVYSIVPNRITPSEASRLREAGVKVMISIESSGMGLYKSFAYEIFKRMPSVLRTFDGNSAAQNLIQEARNGREKCRIFLDFRKRDLAVKARTLEGYVQPLEDAPDYLSTLTP